MKNSESMHEDDQDIPLESSRLQVHHHQNAEPTWHSRLARCPKCGAWCDKSTRQARMDQKPYFRGWHCEQCKRQSLSSRWTCECGKAITTCEEHGQDPLSHSTTKRWAKTKSAPRHEPRQVAAPPMARNTIDKKKGMIYDTSPTVWQLSQPSGVKRKVVFDPILHPRMAAKMAKWEANAGLAKDDPTTLTATDGEVGSSGMLNGS